MKSITKKDDQYILITDKYQITLISLIIQIILFFLESFLIYFYFCQHHLIHIFLWIIEFVSIFIILIKVIIIIQNNEVEDLQKIQQFHSNDLPIYLLMFAHAVLYNEIGLDIYGLSFIIGILLFIICELIFLIRNGKIIEIV